MHLIERTAITFTALALCALAGCATDVEPTDDEQPVEVTSADEDGNAEPQQINLTGPCTTSTSCDANYCCTTTDCRFTTTVECTPRVKVRK